MEFHEKLQELRRRKGITQEELAESLYVSRTAVSKWESGRGYPNLDSLKAIAAYFEVTIDSLLTADAVLPAEELPAESDAGRGPVLRRWVFALSDIGMGLLLFLPLFASRSEGSLRAASLVSLQGVRPYLKVTFLAAVLGLVLWGAIALTAALLRKPVGERLLPSVSVGLGAVAAVLFILARQPYAAVFGVILIAVKAFFLLKSP